MTTQTPDAVREAAIEQAHAAVRNGDYRMGYLRMCEAYGKLAALDSRAVMNAASDLRDFADRVMEAAADCCTDPDAGPSSQTSVSFTGEEGARIANDLHRLIDSRAGDAGEGWKLVPVTPTFEMLNAAIDTDSRKLGDISPLGFRCSPQTMFERCWSAMLAATPAPAVDPASMDGAKIETYDMMHDIAVNDLGYPSILEALEATPHANSAVDAVPAGEVGALRVDWNRRELADAYDMVEAMRQQIAQPAESPLNQSLLAAMDALEAADVEWSGITKPNRSSEA